LGPGRRFLLPASESFATQSLQFEREIFVIDQAKTKLLEDPSEERHLRRDSETTTNTKTVDGTVISRSGCVCG
jgi:hypothetical protein